MSKEIRLFLDDIRVPTWAEHHRDPKDWTVVRTYEEAVELLKTGDVVEATLDHDLGQDVTGYDLVCWMEENNVWPREGTRVHSANPSGSAAMRRVIRKHYG